MNKLKKYNSSRTRQITIDEIQRSGLGSVGLSRYATASCKCVHFYDILHIVELKSNNLNIYLPDCLNIEFTIEPHNDVVYCCCCCRAMQNILVVVCCCVLFAVCRCFLLLLSSSLVLLLILLKSFSFSRRLQIINCLLTFIDQIICLHQTAEFDNVRLQHS